MVQKGNKWQTTVETRYIEFRKRQCPEALPLSINRMVLKPLYSALIPYRLHLTISSNASLLPLSLHSTQIDRLSWRLDSLHVNHLQQGHKPTYHLVETARHADKCPRTVRLQALPLLDRSLPRFVPSPPLVLLPQITIRLL